MRDNNILESQFLREMAQDVLRKPSRELAKVRLPLNLGILAIILLLWAIGFYNLLNNLNIQKIFLDLKNNLIPDTVSGLEIKSEVIEVKSWTLTYVLKGNVSMSGRPVKEWVQKESKELKEITKDHLNYHMHDNQENKRSCEKISRSAQKLLSASNEIIRLKDQCVETDNLLRKYDEDFLPTFFSLLNTLDNHIAEKHNALSAIGNALQYEYSATIRNFILIGLLTVLLASAVAFFMDRLVIGFVAERKSVEETISHLAYHDALTGLPNRLLFNDRLTLALAHAQRNQNKVAVMMLDLDSFKNINDSLGHNIGDQVLQYIGSRLTNLLRKEDTVARMGGDEFILLLPDIDQEEAAARAAQKILRGLQEPFLLGTHELKITTSIGSAIYPDDGEDPALLLQNADVAMYRAKLKGKNNYYHFDAVAVS